MTRKPIFPTPPPPSLAAVTGGGGSGRGCLTCRAGGGGGVNSTSMAQNDTHVALIILTTQMWGGELLVEKTFLGQILCSCAFGANIRSYTKKKGPTRNPISPTPPPTGGTSPRFCMRLPPRRAIFRSPSPPRVERGPDCPPVGLGVKGAGSKPKCERCVWGARDVLERLTAPLDPLPPPPRTQISW